MNRGWFTFKDDKAGAISPWHACPFHMLYKQIYFIYLCWLHNIGTGYKNECSDQLIAVDGW